LPCAAHESTEELVERIALTEQQGIFDAFKGDALTGMAAVRRDQYRVSRHMAHLWGNCVPRDISSSDVTKCLLHESASAGVVARICGSTLYETLLNYHFSPGAFSIAAIAEK
jgi:hypothetical protein